VWGRADDEHRADFMGEMDHFIHNLTQVGRSKEEEEGGGNWKGNWEGEGEGRGKGRAKGRGEIAAIPAHEAPFLPLCAKPALFLKGDHLASHLPSLC
jgi:hypothetical protein